MYHDERDTLYARKPSYITLAHVSDLLMNNIRVILSRTALRQFDRHALAVFESESGRLCNIYRNSEGRSDSQDAELSVIQLHNCRQFLVS